MVQVARLVPAVLPVPVDRQGLSVLPDHSVLADPAGQVVPSDRADLPGREVLADPSDPRGQADRSGQPGLSVLLDLEDQPALAGQVGQEVPQDQWVHPGPVALPPLDELGEQPEIFGTIRCEID